mgnify:CR=1 FL=1
MVTLGKSGIKTSVLGIGSGTRGGSEQRAIGKEAFSRLVHHAYDLGIRYIDTADGYRTHDYVRQAIADLQAEADTRVQALESKWAQAQGALKATLQDRATRVRNAYDNRSAKLSKAWGLTKDALRD